MEGAGKRKRKLVTFVTAPVRKTNRQRKCAKKENRKSSKKDNKKPVSIGSGNNEAAQVNLPFGEGMSGINEENTVIKEAASFGNEIPIGEGGSSSGNAGSAEQKNTIEEEISKLQMDGETDQTDDDKDETSFENDKSDEETSDSDDMDDLDWEDDDSTTVDDNQRENDKEKKLILPEDENTSDEQIPIPLKTDASDVEEEKNSSEDDKQESSEENTKDELLIPTEVEVEMPEAASFGIGKMGARRKSTAAEEQLLLPAEAARIEDDDHMFGYTRSYKYSGILEPYDRDTDSESSVETLLLTGVRHSSDETDDEGAIKKPGASF